MQVLLFLRLVKENRTPIIILISPAQQILINLDFHIRDGAQLRERLLCENLFRH